MQTLYNYHCGVPGGFRYLCRETGKWITAPSWIELVAWTKRHFEANQIPIRLMLEAEIEDQLCSTLPPGFCEQSDPIQQRRAAQIARPGIKEVDSFTRLLVKRWTGKGLVSQDEAEAHGRVCLGCPYNQAPDGCTSCSSDATKEAIEFALGTGKKSTPHDGLLKSCLLCKCHLRSKVWCRPEDIRAASPDLVELLPEWCWVHDYSLAQGSHSATLGHTGVT
jgi:hypothetical protein